MTHAETFRKLHSGPGVLVLANAWDAGSARLIESLGAAAIATTSAGVAWARGYPDGDALPVEQIVAVAREIARVIRVPLTVDIEGGYSDEPSTVAEVVRRVLDAGAVGINLEDGAGPPERLCRKIEAARDAATHAGVDLFVNARTDVYLRRLATGQAAIDEVGRRAGQYRAAGCDGIFVPGAAQKADIAAIAHVVAPLPVNLMLVSGLAPIDELASLGVRRLSAGAAIAKAALARVSQLAAQLLAGSVDDMSAETVDYMATNRLFTRA